MTPEPKAGTGHTELLTSPPVESLASEGASVPPKPVCSICNKEREIVFAIGSDELCALCFKMIYDQP